MQSNASMPASFAVRRSSMRTDHARLSASTVQEGSRTAVALADRYAGRVGGWNPNVALCTHLGGRSRWSDAIAAFVPGDMPRGMRVVGAAAGSLSLAAALREGAAAGAEAARGIRLPNGRSSRNRVFTDELTAVQPFWCVSESRSKAFVDFQHERHARRRSGSPRAKVFARSNC